MLSRNEKEIQWKKQDTTELFSQRRHNTSHHQNINDKIQFLQKSDMFKHVNPLLLHSLCQNIVSATYFKDDRLILQDEKVTRMFVIVEGEILRERTENSKLHQVDLISTNSNKTFGAFHLLNNDTSFATAVCLSNTVKVYVLTDQVLLEHLCNNKELALEVIKSLCKTIKTHTVSLKTPFLQQNPNKVTLIASSIAASVEAFYRSALSALLNSRLSGIRSSIFPNMHLQVPARVLYINGFKGTREWINQYVDPQQFSNPKVVLLCSALAPGIIMTPVTSFLEACTADHMNKENMKTRWMRGYVPRTIREIIFGLGLNNMCDYFEERLASFEQNPQIQNGLASLISGIISSYVSHIPHSLSTLKLMTPHLTYKQHMESLAKQAESRIPIFFRDSLKRKLSFVISVLAPKGLLLRTTQISGSYVILNGIIHLLTKKN